MNSALSHTKDDIKQDYQASAASLSQSNDIRQQYKQDSQAVDTHATAQGFTQMSSEQKASAEVMQAQHRLKPVAEEGAITERHVANQIKHTEIKIKEK